VGRGRNTPELSIVASCCRGRRGSRRAGRRMCVKGRRRRVWNGADGRGVVVEWGVCDGGRRAGRQAGIVVVGRIVDGVENYHLVSLRDLRRTVQHWYDRGLEGLDSFKRLPEGELTGSYLERLMIKVGSYICRYSRGLGDQFKGNKVSLYYAKPERQTKAGFYTRYKCIR